MSTKIIRGRILSECIGFCGPTGFATRAAINDKDGKDGVNEQVFVCPRSESMPYVKVCQGMSRYVKVCQGMSRYVKVCQGMSRYVKVCQGMSRYVGYVVRGLPGWTTFPLRRTLAGYRDALESGIDLVDVLANSSALQLLVTLAS